MGFSHYKPSVLGYPHDYENHHILPFQALNNHCCWVHRDRCDEHMQALLELLTPLVRFVAYYYKKIEEWQLRMLIRFLLHGNLHSVFIRIYAYLWAIRFEILNTHIFMAL